MNEDARRKIEDLFVRYAAGVSRYVLLRVGSPELAEEITARVFLGVVRNFHQAKESLVGWLWAIVRTELSRQYREKPHVAYPPDLAAADVLPADQLDRKERSALLHACLKMMADDVQQIVALKFFLGLSNQEIADTMGLTPSNVGVKLHRGLKELRDRLQGPLAEQPAKSYLYE